MSTLIRDLQPGDARTMTSSAYTHGAIMEADGSTRFALWAPDADSVDLIFSDGSRHSLDHLGEGWYAITMECAPGTAYRYLINDTLPVPDPAARCQLGDVHGLSCLVDPNAYRWTNTEWRGLPWHQTVIYELHVGLMGGFSKVETLLPILAKLGITAIELMPINEFPGTRNWGYDGVLPFAPEASYGTPDELKHLIDKAHGLGIMVFLDVVYNHFGPDGNYLGQYAGAFFRHDIHTPWGAAIDFRKREVRDFFCENALMWINEYRFDGLRLDAVHAISEKDFLVELAERVRASVEPDRQVHLMLENEDNSASLLLQGFDAQWNDDGHNVLHYLLTGEEEGYYADFSNSATTKLARCLREGFIFQGESSHKGEPRGEASGHLPPTAFILFLQNHDQIGNRALGERLRELSEPDALKAALALLLLSPMIPLLFMGEEWGSSCPFLYFTDHEDELAKAVRDGRRAEFASFSKYSDPETRQQIPDPNAISTFLQSKVDIPTHIDQEALIAPRTEREHWWSLYHELLQLRHEHIVPNLPGTRAAGVTIIGLRALCASWVLGNGELLSIYLNLSDKLLTALPAWEDHRVLFNHNISEAEFQAGGLAPFSALVTLHADNPYGITDK